MENINIGNKGSGRSIGPVIGLIVIIAIILIGGIYFWSMRNTDGTTGYKPAQQQNENAGASNTAATINTNVPSSYNSVDVEASLNESDPNTIQTSDL
jgi:flagellar basal body-associated protein FliL